MAEPRTRTLKAPDGSDLVLTDLPDDPSVSIASGVVTTIPEQVHGFAVRTGLGPYPPDAEKSHRKALYIIFEPVSEPAITICKKKNRARVLAISELSADGVALFEHSPDSEDAEAITRETFQSGIREIRRHI